MKVLKQKLMLQLHGTNRQLDKFHRDWEDILITDLIKMMSSRLFWPIP